MNLTFFDEKTINGCQCKKYMIYYNHKKPKYGRQRNICEWKNVACTYDKAGEIEGVKVLFGKEGTGLHDLPAESHSSNMYRYFP